MYYVRERLSREREREWGEEREREMRERLCACVFSVKM